MIRLRGAVLVAAIVLSACGLFRRHESTTTPAPIDLNRASVRKVEELPGITPSMAARIVAGGTVVGTDLRRVDLSVWDCSRPVEVAPALRRLPSHADAGATQLHALP